MQDQLLKHECRFCQKRFACGRSLGGHIRCHLPKPGKSCATSTMSSETEMETLRLIKCNQGNATGLNLAGSNSHSSATSDVVEEEQQEDVDVALCLIMLSRDVGSWGGGKNHGLKNSKKKRKRVEKVQINKESVFTDMKSEQDEKKFISVINCPSPNPDEEQSELSLCYNQIVTENRHGSSSTSSKQVVHKYHKHECSICFRVFSSGQALGGHKRSHLLAYYTETSPDSENRDMLDLNLPPAVIVQKESSVTVTTPHWWVENPHKHEPLLSLISN